MTMTETATGKGSQREKVLSTFNTMRLDGAVGTPPSDEVGSLAYTMRRFRTETGTNKAKALSAISEVFSLLGVRRFAEVREIARDPQKKEDAKVSARRRIERAYAIPDIENAITDYGLAADGIIRALKRDVLQQTDTGSQFEMESEVMDTHDPVELALMIFDNTLPRRKRFEAKRKLQLMELVASVEQRNREAKINEKSAKFNAFLNECVWIPGDLDRVYRVSTHDPETLRCTQAEIKDKWEFPQPYQNVEVIDRRKFKSRNETKPAFVRPRASKEIETQIIKLLVRGEKNPEAAIHDQIGLMVVLDSVEDIKKFKNSLVRSAEKHGSFIKFDEEENTLEDGERDIRYPGSSDKYRNHNFHAIVDGVRVEIILHTNQSYLNSEYELGNAHREYAVSRAFDSGVVGLLFPPEIYGYDEEAKLKTYAINRVRRDIAMDIDITFPN